MKLVHSEVFTSPPSILLTVLLLFASACAQIPGTVNEPTQPSPDLRDVEPLSPEPSASPQPSQAIRDAQGLSTRPLAEAPSAYQAGVFHLVAPYRAPSIPALPEGSVYRLSGLVRDGSLFLSLHDAIVIALANNLDVEIARYNLLLAETDILRARGGGTLRGLDYTIQQTAPGVGATTSPLLITATTGNAASTNAAVTDLSQITQIGSSTQQDLSQNGSSTFSPGPPLPIFDPTLIGEAGYLRRSDQSSLLSTSSSSSNSGVQDYVNVGLDYQQGFSSGAQLDAYVDNSSQVLYASGSQLNPFHAPTVSVTLSQPLLRGNGRAINLRFIRVANINRKVSRLLFEQQLLETTYGISRLYYDLVSLGENIDVKKQSLAAAQQLYSDDNEQVTQGTLAPIELTRAQALLSSSRLDLIQAEGEYRQQEVILREQLMRKLGDAAANFAAIVPTDRIVVPDTLPSLDVPALVQDALANRPDLAQAALQVKADEISTLGSRNAIKPQLNLYANVQTRGAVLVPYETLGSSGTGIPSIPNDLTLGGLNISTIYQGGIQLTIPLRNRIAQADYARDVIQLRQARGRSQKLENDVRQQVENAAIALENAHEAYGAAVESRKYQEELLQAEKDKYAVGASTNFLIVQDQAYLAQARSTEVAARSDWMKARIALDRALGNLLQKNNVMIEDAIREEMH
jgi:outer membrane protein TolC